jgi:hypothetical protein
MSKFINFHSTFDFLIKEMNEYPLGTLGWLLAAQEFNSQIDFMCEYTNFEFEEFALKFPHNTEIRHRGEFGEFLRTNGPKIIIPDFNLNQVLENE